MGQEHGHSFVSMGPWRRRKFATAEQLAKAYVGESLYRLYTIILNARLLSWTKEHGLRSPAQAGFRPGNESRVCPAALH